MAEDNCTLRQQKSKTCKKNNNKESAISGTGGFGSITKILWHHPMYKSVTEYECNMKHTFELQVKD